MAVCKNCGCAIPLGSKSCDMCAAVGSVAPAPPTWTPPKVAAAPRELSSSAASWAAEPRAVRAPLPAEIERAKKGVASGFRIFAIIGILNLGLGLLAELAGLTALKGLFNWYSAIEGAIFLVIAYFVRSGSMVATVIGASLYFLDTVALMFAGYFSIVRIVIMVFLGRAILSAYLLRQQRKAMRQQQPLVDQSRAA
jgi:hypothetical protein